MILLKCVDGGGLLQDLVPNYDCMTSKPRLLPFAAFWGKMQICAKVVWNIGCPLIGDSRCVSIRPTGTP